MYGLEINWILE